MKKEFVQKIEELLIQYANQTTLPDVSIEPMEKQEFLDIVEKWNLSNGFLQRILGKSRDSIANYKYRNGLIPEPVAVRIRRLDAILENFSQSGQQDTARTPKSHLD